MHDTKHTPTLIGTTVAYVNQCISLCLFWIQHFLFVWLHTIVQKIVHFIPFGPQCSKSGRAFVLLTRFTELIKAKPYITNQDVNIEPPKSHYDKMLLLRKKLIKLFDNNLRLLYPNHSYNQQQLIIEPVTLFNGIKSDEQSFFITTKNNKIGGSKGTVIYYHGGGFMCGESTTYANILTPWLYEHNFDCLVVDYGLCPYYTPEQIGQQGRKAYDYLVNERGVDPRSIVCAGESAGANLSLQVVRELVAEGNYDRLPAGLALFSPWVDLTLSTNSWKNSGPDMVLTDNMCRLGEKLEIFSPDLSRQFSPIHFDLSHFPPCFVSWGAEERLSDECQILCDRLTNHGVELTKDVHPGMFHAFTLFHKYIHEGKLSFDRAASFIKKNIR